MRNLVAAALLLFCAAAGAQNASLPPLPPLTDPATNQQLPGKFVWADLFTNNVERTREFYEQVFGWEWRLVTSEPEYYGLLYNKGKPVAGIVHKEAPGGSGHWGRWVHFLSTANVKKTGAAILRQGGEELLGRRKFEQRGEFAIYAGPGGEIIGLIRSAAGDPVDYQPPAGGWSWWQLFAEDVKTAVDYYGRLFGYRAYEEQVTPELLIVYLSAHDYARAAIGPLPEDPRASPNWIGFIHVDDVTQTLKKVVDAGGKVPLAPDPEIRGGDLAVVEDPVGALVGLLRWDDSQPMGEVQP